MRFSLTAAPLLATLAHTVSASSCYAAGAEPCLSSGEATNIAKRYLTTFNTDNLAASIGAQVIPTTFAENFTYYDKGASFGASGPLYGSRQNFSDAITGSGYIGALFTGATYTLISSFASCDTIGLRWVHHSKASNATGVTVPVGTAVTYKGIDYIQVDLATRLVYNGTSSSDLLNLYIGLDYDIIAEKLHK